MKRLLTLALVTSLSACGIATVASAPATTPAPPGVIAKADTVILTGERAFAAAELAYITAADGVGRLADNGLIVGTTADKVRGWNREARDLLVRGKATTNAVEQARAAAALFGIADRLNLIRSK